ncbi:50S ribosomal protein L3, partial [Candidatus Woesearchaeota archaeon]
MVSACVQDNTEHSMTKGKKIIIPMTLLEAPKMKIFSVRFYKNNNVQTEILTPNLDRELKRKLKLPKKQHKLDSIRTEDYDDLRIIVYSMVKKTGLKKKPDVLEIGLGGSYEDKLAFVKENLSKELSIYDFFEKGEL